MDGVFGVEVTPLFSLADGLRERFLPAVNPTTSPKPAGCLGRRDRGPVVGPNPAANPRDPSEEPTGVDGKGNG